MSTVTQHTPHHRLSTVQFTHYKTSLNLTVRAVDTFTVNVVQYRPYHSVRTVQLTHHTTSLHLTPRAVESTLWYNKQKSIARVEYSVMTG